MGVVVPTLLISFTRLAVDNQGTAVRQVSQKLARFRGKRMFATIACSITPPNLTLCIGNERVEHGEHRRGPDAGAQQHDRTVAFGQREATSGCADLKHVAYVDAVIEEAAPWAFRALYADAIGPGARRTGHRIAAQGGGAL